MSDQAYAQVRYSLSELGHAYGSNVHILGHPVLLTRLAELCAPKIRFPQFNRLVGELYQTLAEIVANAEFPRSRARFETRLHAAHPEAVLEGELIDPRTRVVCASILRAGSVPSEACFRFFGDLLDPAGIRQDHLMMNRRTDDQGRVSGIDFKGSKVGGSIDGAILIIPDPMGATGSSLCAALEAYAAAGLGTPKKIVALHLIVAAEYLRTMRKRHPEIQIYAIRLDRGLSPPDVLRTALGERADEERGLNDRGYIIPGGGGFGELINNADR